MTALATERNTLKYDSEGPIPEILNFPMAATTKVYQGSIGALNASGNMVPGSASTALLCVGRIGKTVDNTTGIAGALTANVRQGVFKFANSPATDLIAAANVGQNCYLVDDQTVALTNGAGTRSLAGVIYKVDGDGGVWVLMGLFGPDVRSLVSAAGASTPGQTLRARYAVTANVAALAAFTVAQDGVTGVAGDIVLLTGQTTAAQNGLYVLGTVAGGTAPLTRPGQFPAGGAILNGGVVDVAEGTLWGGSQFKAFGSGLVNTNDPTFYPRNCRATVTLVAGAYTLGATEGLLLRSTTRSMVEITRNTANTSTATTGGYSAPVASRTAGVSGTGAVLVRAEVAAGTLNNADLSTLDVLVTNY